MGRKEKEENREKESRDSRKRRHKGRSPSPAKSSDVSRAKKVKQERESDRPREEKNRDVREKEKPRRIKEEKDAAREDRKDNLGKGSSPPPPTASSTNEASISIEETNRIRAELGLKPLELGSESSEASVTEKKDVHVPAENIREKKKTEDIRQKLEERKEKRKIEQRLASFKTLAETAAEEDDDAANWVEKSRKLQLAKEEAQKRAKMLEEMDQAFGVGEIIDTEISKVKAKAYTGRDLQGLRVEHDREDIAEGKAVVLTLKDQNILDEEGGDVLINVNMIDDERYKKNNEVKKQKPGYQPFEEDLDDLGLPKTKSLLAKYDQEIDGEKRESFVLGAKGEEEAQRKAMDRVKDKLKLQQKKVESLESRPLKIASEYYTQNEMTSFKKVKRRVKKIRSKSDQMLKADDLLATTSENTLSDLGSRSKKMEVGEIDAATEDLSGIPLTVEDNAIEFRQAIEKAKKRKEKKSDSWNLEAMVNSIKREPMEEDVVEDPNKTRIVLNETAEFCRTLGDIPTYGMAGNRDEDEDELMDFERQLAEERKRNLEKEERKREAERLQERGGWNVLEKETGSDDSMDIDNQDGAENGTVILDEEPVAGSGMGAALKLAMSKGYLEKEETKRITVSKSGQELQAQRYTIEDKVVEDDKYSRRHRFDGPVTEFKEKEGYKPTPKLEYIDDNGKPLNVKEAFRHLSHKFHGKGSGKLKSEKRAKKQDDKQLLNRMSSTDTPLNTLKKLKDKQKETNSPYVVLSGKATTTSITKPGKGKK